MPPYYTTEQAATINWAERWKRHRIPQRLWGLGLESFRVSEGNAECVNFAVEFVKTWRQRYLGANPEAPEDRSLIGRGLIFVGSAGSGKTHLACATATTIHQLYNDATLYMPVTNFFALGRDLQDAKDTAVKLGDPESLAELNKLRALKRSVFTKPLYVGDDMGKEYSAASGFVGTEVHRILRTRYDKGLPSILTTNVPLTEWSSRYDPAMYSFLHEAFDVAAFSIKDQRRARK